MSIKAERIHVNSVSDKSSEKLPTLCTSFPRSRRFAACM